MIISFARGSTAARAWTILPRMTQNRIAALGEILARLSHIADGIRACAVFDADGFVIAAHGNGKGDELAALCADLAASSARATDRLATGETNRLLVEAAGGTLVICRCGDAWLAAQLDKDASLAHALFAVGKAADEIA